MPTEIAGKRSDGQVETVGLSDGGRLQVEGPAKSFIVRTEPVTVPIVTGAAYAAEDALGTKFEINDIPEKGVILSALAIDTDDEAIEFQVYLFDEDFAGGTNNSAFALAAGDHSSLVGVLTIDTFKAVSGGQVGVANNIGLAYSAPQGRLYAQAVTSGTPNYAAGTGLQIVLSIMAD